MEQYLITITFGIPDTIKDKIKKLAAAITKDLNTAVDMPEPHITIYQCKINQADLDQVITYLKDLGKLFKEVIFENSHISIKNQYVGIAYKQSDAITFIHEKIVKGINEFRGNFIRSTYIENKNKYSEEEQTYINTYGYPYVLDNYIPHLTLFAFENKEDIKNIDTENIVLENFASSQFEIIIKDKDKKEIYKIPFLKK